VNVLFGLSLCSQAIVGNAVTDDDTRMVDDDGTMPKAPEAIDFSRQGFTPPAGSPCPACSRPFFLLICLLLVIRVLDSEREQDRERSLGLRAALSSLHLAALSLIFAWYLCREQEAADDDEDKANDVYAEKAKRMLQQKQQQMQQQKAAPVAARKTNDDYDEYDDEDAGTGVGSSSAAAAPAASSSAGAATSGKDAMEMDSGNEASQKSEPAPRKPVEPPVEVRRNGLLLFSDMFIAPPTTTSRMPSRRKNTNINAKIEYMSDEEEKFVDEAARRGAAAAALRLREQHEACMADEGEEAEEEEDDEDEDKSQGFSRQMSSISRQSSCTMLSFSRQNSADVSDSNAAADVGAAADEGAAGAAAQDNGKGQGAIGPGGAASSNEAVVGVGVEVKTALPTWEARSWENDIMWGDSSEEEDRDDDDEEVTAAAGMDEAANIDEFDEDEFEAELDVEGAGGGVGGSSGDGSWKRSGNEGWGGGGGGGGDGRREDEEDEEKRRKVIQQRITDAKRYFLERENMPKQNAVRIGEYNKALEQGYWISHIIWSDHDRTQSNLSLAARHASGGRRLTLRRPVKGKESSSILGNSILAPHSHSDRVHACIPPWWSRRGPDSQARHALLLDELAENLDLSHDAYYQEAVGTKARIKLGRPSVLHAPVMRHLQLRQVRDEKSKDSYRTDFHRNRIFRNPKAAYSISFTPQEVLEGDGCGAGGGKERREIKGAEEKIQALKHLRDVTAKDSKNLLVEHLEETPPLMSNSGMASRIKHYYRSKTDQPPPTIPADVLADGKPVGLDPQQVRTATHWSILQHSATHCDALRRTATQCNALRHTATYCNALRRTATQTGRPGSAAI